MPAVETRSGFANNLIALRKNRGLSQRDLAERSGISRRMIAYYETHAVIPPVEKLELIAKILNASVADLVDPKRADRNAQPLSTRTLKKIQMLEQLPLDDQKKVVDYIKDLLAKNTPKN